MATPASLYASPFCHDIGKGTHTLSFVNEAKHLCFSPSSVIARSGATWQSTLLSLAQ